MNDNKHANVHIIFAQPFSAGGANHTQIHGSPRRVVSIAAALSASPKESAEPCRLQTGEGFPSHIFPHTPAAEYHNPSQEFS